ncbi:hypothetical protein BIV57_13105 [Mangrovactinospora gilvigrisea]|uniref:Lsr2 family protein n=1 Tax=Mangrovactinospora gilvigrisea TaxID=1428644 RepID=A0A1J7CBL9_9ACTN|nr:Lsr2 family protein [Mangrovactinospora gilvigrisea]OIV37042.1 hypothetical protein BIV57_13105 [Mangrovactinospora gilvigrisea]
MAQQVKTILIDDLDGSSATGTVRFGYQGVDYEIDLNDDHQKALEESVREWIGNARRTGGRKQGVRPASGASDTSAIRVWAKENGYQVNTRGRIAAEIVEAYQRAH